MALLCRRSASACCHALRESVPPLLFWLQKRKPITRGTLLAAMAVAAPTTARDCSDIFPSSIYYSANGAALKRTLYARLERRKRAEHILRVTAFSNSFYQPYTRFE